jgi:hypothetical protein
VNLKQQEDAKMAKRAERQEVEFAFDDGSCSGAARGKTRCGICTGRFTMPEVATTLGEFLICPSCVLSGPAAVAAEAKRTAGDKDRSAMWECEDPADTRSIAKECLALASRLRRVKSFYEIRGGMVALAIAGVTAGNGSKRFHEDKVLIISQAGVKMWRGHREKRTHRKAA